MTIIIDGRKMSKEILASIKEEVATLSFQLVFCDILVGEDSVSAQYVNMKAKNAESIGIKFQNAHFPANITTEKLIEEIKILNKIPNMCGIIVQLPIPESLDQQKIIDAIDPKLDVDFLGSTASDLFYANKTNLGFPTALACMKILDSLNLDLKDKKVVIMGRGKLVGKPVAALFQFRNIEPIIINSKTENRDELMREADIIISGIGKGKYIKGENIKNGAVIIDAGTSESNSGIVGDVDLESVTGVAGFVSPVPGGVGPMTVAMLFKNVLEVAKQKIV